MNLRSAGFRQRPVAIRDAVRGTENLGTRQLALYQPLVRY